MITREALVSDLTALNLSVFGIDVTIGTMNGQVEPSPWPTGAVLAAFSRKVDTERIVEDFTEEIKNDLALISEKYPEVRRYGIFFYQVPADIAPHLVRYAKITDKS